MFDLKQHILRLCLAIIATLWFMPAVFAESVIHYPLDTDPPDENVIPTNTSYEPGKVGNALSLDGTGYILYRDFSLTPGSFTLSLWVYANNPADDLSKSLLAIHAEDGDKSVIMQWDASSQTLRILFILFTTTEAQIIEELSLDGIQPETWYFLTLVRQADVFKLYLNGENRGEETKTALSDFAIEAGFLNLGTTDGEEYEAQTLWEGLIDDIRLDNGVIPDHEILARFNNNTGTVEEQPNQKPTASFEFAELLTGNPDAGELPVVYRLDAGLSLDSDGQIQSYQWTTSGEFFSTQNGAIQGDIDYLGDSSDQRVVFWRVDSGGDYTVTLAVTDNEGATSDDFQQEKSVKQKPIALFDPFLVVGSETNVSKVIYLLDARDSYDEDGQITNYQWSVTGGALFSSQEEAEVEGATAGTTASQELVFWKITTGAIYTVTLTVTDDEGFSSQASQEKDINQRPIAKFELFQLAGEPTNVSAEQPVLYELNAGNSSDQDGQMTLYDWSVSGGELFTTQESAVAEATEGEGTSVSTQNERIFWRVTAGGTYSIALSVTDDDEVKSRTFKTEQSLNEIPIALFNMTLEEGDPILGNDLPVIYELDASTSYDNDGQITRFDWSVEGGELFNTQDGAINGDAADSLGTEVTLQNSRVFWRVESIGTYSITLTVMDDDNTPSNAFVKDETINEIRAVLKITKTEGEPETGQLPVKYFLYAGDSDSLNGIKAYQWSVSGGELFSDDPAATSPGTENVPPTTSPETENDPATSPETDDTPPTSPETNNEPPTSLGTSVTFQEGGTGYWWQVTTGGRYTITLTVTDHNDQINTSEEIVAIKQSPTAAVTDLSLEPLEVGEVITLDATQSQDEDGNILHYEWIATSNLGHEHQASGSKASLQLTDPGTYSIVLTVTDNDGLISQGNVQTVTVVSTPTAVAKILPADNLSTKADGFFQGERPLTITLDGTQSSDIDGEIISYEWQAIPSQGNMVQSQLGNQVNMTFETPDVYRIVLKVTDNSGLSHEDDSQTVRVLSRPTAMLDVSPQQGIAPLTVNLNGTASSDIDGQITQYEWSSSGTEEPVFGSRALMTFYTPGTYAISLTVTDSDGLTHTATYQNITVEPPPEPIPPIADFVLLPAPNAQGYIGVAGITVTLDGSQSIDADGSIMSYEWSASSDEGEQLSTSGRQAKMTFDTPGTYAISLTVADNDELTDTKTVQNIEVEPPSGPVANIVLSPTPNAQSYIGVAPITVTLDGSQSIEFDGSIIDYQWTASSDDEDQQLTASGSQTDMTFDTPGTYAVSLTVTDSNGLTNTATQNIKVEPPCGPIADFVLSPAPNAESYIGVAPIKVTLDGSQSIVVPRCNEGSITAYEWTALSDEGQQLPPAFGQVANMTFDIAGTYAISLTVTDSNGLTDTATQNIKIKPPCEPIAKAVLSPAPNAEGYIGVAPITVTLDGSQSEVPDYCSEGFITAYEWTALSDEGQQLPLAFGQVANMTFDTPGTYTITLLVKDDLGLTGTDSQVIEVGTLNAVIEVSADRVQEGETLVLDGGQSIGHITNYQWTVEPAISEPKSGSQVEMPFLEEGTYTITLTITDGKDTVTDSQRIVVEPVLTGPTAIAKVEPLTGQAPLKVTLEGNDSFDEDGYITGYEWSALSAAGEAEPPESGTNAEMVFTESGSYGITLTVTDNDKFTGIETVNVSVEPPSQLEAFATPSTRCESILPISLEATWNQVEPDKRIHYSWSATPGDKTAVGKQAEMSFEQAGDYTITVTADYLDYDFKATATKPITVKASEPPTAVIDFPSEQVEEKDPVDLDATQSQVGNAFCEITRYEWSIKNDNNEVIQEKRGDLATMTFPVTGWYMIDLTVTDNLGLENQVSERFWVEQLSPELKATFTVDPPSGVVSEEEPLLVTVDASQSYDPNYRITQYEWTACFDEQPDCQEKWGSSDKVITEMRFDSGGIYEIKLKVTNENGDSDIFPRKLKVNEKPKAVIKAMPIFSNLPITVKLDASDSYDDGRIIQYDWTVDGYSTKMASGERAELVFDKKDTYSVVLTVTDDQGETDRTSTEVRIDELNKTVRFKPQVLAAGATPTLVDNEEDRFDVIAWVRPGLSPIKQVSFQDTNGYLKMKMELAGVLQNGDEIYKATYTFEGSLDGLVVEEPWGPGTELDENGLSQFRVIATDEAQEIVVHIFPHLFFGNLPPQPAQVEIKSLKAVNYDNKARISPQVILAGYSPAMLDFGDGELDVFAIVRPGELPIGKVVLKQNEEGLFQQVMDLMGELDNGDRVYKLTYTYTRGTFGVPEDDDIEITLKDLWGTDASQFGIEVVDETEQHRHQFPAVRFGDYPALDNQ